MRSQLDAPGAMTLQVLIAWYFQVAALGADKRPVRERNHRSEGVAHDTVRTPNYSLRHRGTSLLAIEVETKI